ncbi:MAG TPA: hypothetical protein VNW92_26445 [Polyangiaceae bacterium]|jgi:hypothetical protein|nr:hypothetical protein [Polyangiaceae bacterium]
MEPEIYVSTDIEADGPIPGPHSMLSFASAAYRADKTLVGTFTRNLETLEGARAAPKTEAWWKTQPEAWEACRRDLSAPDTAMHEYAQWLRALPGKPVFVGYPASYDFMFVYWYLMKFVGESPFSHSALDIKTFAMCLLGSGYRDSTKKNMPRRWFDDIAHTHVALDDALGQGALFCNMLRASRERRE